MELQFNQRNCQYLHRQVWDVQNLEQTQEVRLSDGMPDLGKILCAWGQCVLRSKEWRNDIAQVSGGVMAWVLYAPEDGSEPQCVEVWLPFQGKWNLTDSHREGTIRADACLRALDARTLSARKIMVRASVGLLGEALESVETAIYTPGELPEGVQVLRKHYPAMLPTEAGEKLFTWEEEIALHGDAPKKLLSCRVHPEITERNVVGGRVVFRGNCRVHITYMTQSGRIFGQKVEIPMAQYADLDRDYDKEATACVMMAVSSLEPELKDNSLALKCGMIAQYVVYHRQMVEVAEDAYSLYGKVNPAVQELQLPMVLDRLEQVLPATPPDLAEAAQTVDICFYPDQPSLFREGDQLQGQMTGFWQVLYYDQDGNLQCGTEGYREGWTMPMGEKGTAYVFADCLTPQPRLQILSVAGETVPMITGLQVGDRKEPDPARPSLILRRPGGHSLWDLAKTTGSTVEDICKANQLTAEPEPQQILLIPVR